MKSHQLLIRYWRTGGIANCSVIFCYQNRQLCIYTARGHKPKCDHGDLVQRYISPYTMLPNILNCWIQSLYLRGNIGIWDFRYMEVGNRSRQLLFEAKFGQMITSHSKDMMIGTYYRFIMLFFAQCIWIFSTGHMRDMGRLSCVQYGGFGIHLVGQQWSWQKMQQNTEIK